MIGGRAPAGGTKRPLTHVGRNLLVRVAEGHAFGDELLGGVGGAQQRIGCRLLEPCVLERQLADEGGQRLGGRRRRPVERRTREPCPPGDPGCTRAAAPSRRRAIRSDDRAPSRPSRARARPRRGSASAASSTSRWPPTRAAGRSRTRRSTTSRALRRFGTRASGRPRTRRDSRGRSHGPTRRRASCAAAGRVEAARAWSRPAPPIPAATPRPGRPRRRTVPGRARASPPTPAGGGRP